MKLFLYLYAENRKAGAKLDMVHASNPSTQETGAELWVQGQPGLHSKTLSQKNKKGLG
jgi:hypothetical protein